jgi:hypothetical protein
MVVWSHGAARKKQSDFGMATEARRPIHRQAEDRDGGLTVVRLSPRVVLDLVITTDDELMTFVRIDGRLLGELHVIGKA